MLLVDTGAGRTAITRNILEQIGYTKMTKDSKPSRTATGLVYFDMVKIAKLELGGEFAFADVNVHVLEWKNSHLHGVIGMDILSKLHIHSDTVNFVIQSKPFCQK
ncbi:MAG: retroviral-like aspartic protease family protein [Turicibacter sp.]|nr:retroviral-like aspartic protease family protein [Turicibacter sp.]